MEEKANGAYSNNYITDKKQTTNTWLECEQLTKCDYRD